MITIKDFIKKSIPEDGDDLVELSDQIWKLGDLEKIKKRVSAELFAVHIVMNVIGNWQGDGWYGIFRDQSKLIPYISQALEELGMKEIKEAFHNVMDLFPKFVNFDDDKLYCDVINFMINPRISVYDERLKLFSKEERQHISEQYHIKMEILDDLSELLWGYGAPKEGWGSVLNYIKQA